jgi:hypothetical protein
MSKQAIAESESAVVLSGRNPVRLAGLAQAYAAAGRRNDARKLLEELRGSARHSYIPPCLFAMIYTALGEQDQAFLLLDQAYAQHDPYLMWLKVDEAFDPLRGNPQFKELLRRMGFVG